MIIIVYRYFYFVTVVHSFFFINYLNNELIHLFIYIEAEKPFLGMLNKV